MALWQKRRFLLTAHPIFDPVDAAVSIIHRTNLMGVPFDEPIGVWSPSMTIPFPYRFVRDSDVSRIMREACEHAYPDPAHYMRQHIQQIVPHSNRVTAAVCPPTYKIVFRQLEKQCNKRFKVLFP